MSKSFLFTLFFYGLLASASAQKADSLWQVYQQSSGDSLRFERYFEFINAELKSLDSNRLVARFDTLEALAKQLGQPYFRGRHAFLAARMERRFGRIQEQRQRLEQAQAYFTQAKNALNKANTDYAVARTYLPEGDYENAFLYYEKALHAFREMELPELEANSLNALGVVQRRAGNLEEAIVYLRQAAALSRSLGVNEGEATALMNQAIIHKTREEYELAIPLYQRGLELAAEPPGDPGMEAYIRNNLSSLYSATKQYELALREVQKAYAYFAANGRQREEATTLLGIGTNLSGLGRHKEAIAPLRQALSLGREELVLQRDIYIGLSQSFEYTNQVDSALYYHKLSTNIANELADENRMAALAEVEARYQNKEKQDQIDKLAAEDVRKQATLKRRNWILGIGAAVLLAVLLLLRSVMRQRSKISAQNRTIQKALEEKEILMKEIHHRVKNNLQMVSSLLNLQSRYVTDSAAVDALQLGKSRVRSMAMIHQRLYTGAEVSTLVDAKAYLEKLCEEIISSYQPEGTEIELEMDIVAGELDIDTLIPLGLLVNEAITNAVKYAFAGRTTGQMTLSLQPQGDQLQLKITDDGPGLAAPTTTPSQSFGNLLMDTLADQLEGELVRESSEKGTCLRLVFQC